MRNLIFNFTCKLCFLVLMWGPFYAVGQDSRSRNSLSGADHGQNRYRVDSCDQRYGNTSTGPFPFLVNKNNNYAGRYQSVVCKMNSSLSSDANLCQDCAIYGLFKEIDTLYYRINQITNCKPFGKCKVAVEDLMPIDTFLGEVAKAKVVMMNDDHARMESRSLFLSLLPKFKKLGFTHLAMEAFQNLNESIPSINVGYYFQEPIMAEISREAKRLGFRFIAYEDTSRVAGMDRDSVQAYNLYKQVRKLKEYEKVLVFSGHMHIAEEIPAAVPFAPFATTFKSISGIDPVTIDQTRGIPNNLKSCDIVFDVDANASGIFLSNCVKDKIGCKMVDAFYFHHQTAYKYGRPTWLECGKLRKHVAIKSRYPYATLIQVYYVEELRVDRRLEYVTPADMVPKADSSGILHFYLIPGHKYVVVYRDEHNSIIGRHRI